MPELSAAIFEHPVVETIKSEMLKTAMELTLNGLSRFQTGERFIEAYANRGGRRFSDPALHTTVAGIEFDNPVMVGAGWDKKGRAVRGLYNLGFSGVEVGTVPLFGQSGNPKPRLWTIDNRHSVGLNRLGFNAPGSDAVERNLEDLGELPCPVGINIGLNKLMPHDKAPWAHAAVVPSLYKFASYFTINVSSPNTPDLRVLQNKEPLTDIVKATQEAMEDCGGQKPLFVKISPDLSFNDIDDVVGVAIDNNLAGLVAVNTTILESVKARYGERWAKEAGGISGDDWLYAAMAPVILRHIYELKKRSGNELEIIGVGGINKPTQVIEMMMAGASIVQVVTAIREHRGKTASLLNRGVLKWMKSHKVKNLKEIVGAATEVGMAERRTSGSL